MKIAVLLSFFIITSCFQSKKLPDSTETTISKYYFIRHAEKDESNKSDRNPHLIEIGRDRAEKWTTVLNNEKLDKVYSTDYHRTKETANPIAIKNNTQISIYDPRNIDSEKFLKETSGKKVLVVGHSNTIPAFVNSIVGSNKYKDIHHNNYGNLYIVTIINNKTSSQLLTIN